MSLLEGDYKLSVNFPEELVFADRRLYNLLILNAYEGLPASHGFSINLKNLKGAFIPNQLPDEHRLLIALRRLMQTLVRYRVDYPAPHWRCTGLLSEAQIDIAKTTLTYRFSSVCQEILTDPMLLEHCLIQMHFQTKYSRRIYAIIAEQYYSGQKQFIVNMADLRDQLFIEGNKLKNYSDFYRFVLEPAMEEINTHASFAISAETIRQGRGGKVTGITFNCEEKYPVSNNMSPKDVIPTPFKLFITEPEKETALALLINAPTKIRSKYFKAAQAKAKESGKVIANTELDNILTWYEWIYETIQH